MSSVSISVSGQRALTSTVNAPEMTSAQMPTKGDDNATINIGNAREVRAILPPSARLERIQGGGSQYLRLVIPGGGASLQLFAGEWPRPEEETPGGSWPHFTIHVGRQIQDYYADKFEVVEVVHERLGDLLPATD